MAVQYEIKSQLAKLLATEDLVVEHKSVETACFNVHTRVLTLPLWEKASNTVYDLLVGHEVGHALYTPDEDWTQNVTIPHQFVNIVEDARIEKLMKGKYPGLSKTFYKGYKELSDQDFFSIEGEDLTTFNLADRANLYFKIGNYIDVPFSDEENEIIEMISDCSTFADVLIAAEELYKYCKNQENEQQKIEFPNTHEQTGSNSSGASSDEEIQPQNSDNDIDESQPSEETSNNQEDTTEGDVDTPVNKTESEEKEPEVRTDSSLSEKIKSLVNKHGSENCYVEIPEINLDSAVVDYKEFHEYINDSFSQQQRSSDELRKVYGGKCYALFSDADSEYQKFKKSAQKEVNYLVKEFECKKSADSYARASISKTGILDCSKLHTYKYNEDLFKKVTTLSDGKNHGLIFILDWSGSMASVLQDTIKQLFNLIWFCKKTNIPFEVYAFTNNWKNVTYDENNKPIYPSKHYEAKDGQLIVDRNFCLLNFLSNRIKSSEFENCMKNIWRLVFGYKNGVSYDVPSRASLSGTPLNESLICLNQIIPKFQKENKLQKVQCVVLTDGEAHHLNRHSEINLKWENETRLGTRSINPETTFLRDRKTGKTYSFGHNYHEFTQTLLNNLQDRFPSTNFIGIRIIESRNAHSFIRMHTSSTEEFSRLESIWKKTRSFTLKETGYDAYFGISSNALSQDSEFEVADCATKIQIRNAFKKSLSSKKMNKKILGEFVSLIA